MERSGTRSFHFNEKWFVFLGHSKARASLFRFKKFTVKISIFNALSTGIFVLNIIKTESVENIKSVGILRLTFFNKISDHLRLDKPQVYQLKITIFIHTFQNQL